jgi:hypothetical protein
MTMQVLVCRPRVAPAAKAALSYSNLRRAGIWLLLGSAVALWLSALPALLQRDGLHAGPGDCSRHSFRDPVTGRAATTSSARSGPLHSMGCGAATGTKET